MNGNAPGSDAVAIQDWSSVLKMSLITKRILPPL